MAEPFERADTEAELSRLRDEIDRFDGWILALLRARGQVVMEVARLKRRRGLQTRDPDRETKVLTALTRSPPTPFSDEEIRQVFQAIFSVCVRLQKRNPGNDTQADPP